MSSTPPSPVLKVLVVDDQPLIRRGLALTLAAEPGIDIVGQAADGEEAIALARQHRPDIVLMDLKMPRMSGVAATRTITDELPGTQVVVLTTYDTDELVFDAIRAGAQAYLLKDATEEELIETMRAVHRGESRLQPQLARKVLEELRRTQIQAATASSAAPRAREPQDATFTPQESRVLELIAQGLSNREIAQAVSLAEGTVKNYASRIMEKLHVRSRTELAVKALQRRHGGDVGH